MKFFIAATLAGVMTAAAFGQSAKPSPYQGVSHPPQDDILTNDIDTPNTQNAAIAASQPAAHMASMPTSTEDQEYPEHPGLVSRAPAAIDNTASNSNDPDADIVTSVPAGPNQLPPGTTLTVALNQQLSTATTQPGAMFSARVVQPVLKNNRIVIPIGSTLTGRVTEITYGRRIATRASIHLRPDEVLLPDGTRYFLHAVVYDVGGSAPVHPNNEGDVVRKDDGKRTMAEAGLLGGGAAAAGFMIAGGPAALIAGGVAAGYVGTRWLLQDHQAVLPKNSEVVFGLTQPMTLVSFHE
jgi:hypothetical protein